MTITPDLNVEHNLPSKLPGKTNGARLLSMLSGVIALLAVIIISSG